MKERRIIILLALLLMVPIAYRCSRSFEWNMLKDPEPAGKPKPAFTDLLATIARPSPSQLNEQLDRAPGLVNERAKLGLTLLEAAVNAKCRDCITVIAQHGADLELKTSTGITPLELALQKENPGPIFELIHQGAKADLTPEARLKLAKQAIRHDDPQVLEVLLDHGLDPNQKIDDRDTLLTEAVDHLRVLSVHALLKAGADPNLPEPRPPERRPLEILDNRFEADKTPVEILKALLEAGADPNATFSNGELLLMRMLKYQRLPFFKLLHDYGADPLKKNRYGFSAVDRWGRGETSRMWLSKEVYSYNHDPFHVLIEMKWNDRVRELLAQDPGRLDRPAGPGGWPPLWRAASAGNEEIVILLLEQGAAITDPATDPGLMHLAAESGMIDLIKLLLERGQDINQPDRNGCTPLHYALAMNPEEAPAARLLVEHGADVNAWCENLQTPLSQAAAYNEEAALMLIDHGARVSPKLAGPDKISELNWAISTHHEDAACRLVEAGADVNEKWAGGYTPLHRAVRDCMIKTAHCLIDHGADVNARDEDGLTPLAYRDKLRQEGGDFVGRCPYLDEKEYQDFRKYLIEQGAPK